MFMKLQGKWTIWQGSQEEELKEVVRKQYGIPQEKILDFQFLLNNRRPLNPRGTLKENQVRDASTVVIIPKLRGGSQSTLFNHGFRRKSQMEEEQLAKENDSPCPNQPEPEPRYIGIENSQEPEQGLRLGTWNVNSIRTAEAELYALIEQHQPDILML